MGDEGERHVRRRRYRGTHPRSFSEKYKERQPERYREDVERVLARGDTPAGSHRPIMVGEILAALAPRPGETAVDATLGWGGHARAVLLLIAPGGRLLGFDRDAGELARTAERLARDGIAGEAFIPVHASFSRLREVLDDADIDGVDLLLADLGVSSMQLDDPARGFSFKRRGPLDMRMDPGEGMTARDYLAGVPEDSLSLALRENADEAEAGAIARAICRCRGKLATTRDLSEAICSAFPDLAWGDPLLATTLQRAFQAIRIEVNGEFAALEALLAQLPSCVSPGGRVAFLSFHSGEDSRVEAAFREGLGRGLWSSVAGEVLRPGKEERHGNPRSGSAKFRWAIRAGGA